MTTIWALFSVENNYDQPDHNLHAWWVFKPDFDKLAKALGLGQFPCGEDAMTLYVVNMWQGKGGGQIRPSDTSYYLREIREGVLSDD